MALCPADVDHLQACAEKYASELWPQGGGGGGKREATAAHQRYESYKSATTLEDFFQKGGNWTDLKYDFSHGYVLLVGEDGAKHHKNDPSNFARGANPPLILPLQADGAVESPDSREPPCNFKEPPEKRRKIIQELETVRDRLADAYEALGRLTVLLDAVVD